MNMETVELNQGALFEENQAPLNITTIPAVSNSDNDTASDIDDLSSLLVNLNKQVNSADSTVGNISKRREELQKKELAFLDEKRKFDEDRMRYEAEMREGYQKFNEEKQAFEQEKYKIYNEIQRTREALAKEKRDFDKMCREENNKINQNKILLKKNYEQFNSIVATFNKKLDTYKDNN